MKSRVHNPKYLEKYFTQFPNIIDDSDLSPYEYRLLIHYYRVGECWEGVRKTSEICKMSTGKVAQCRQSLADKGFIRIKENGDGIIIHLVDLSIRNIQKYSPDGVHVVNTKESDRCSCGEQGCSCGEHKNNQIKKNPIPVFENTGEEESPNMDLFGNEEPIKSGSRKEAGTAKEKNTKSRARKSTAGNNPEFPEYSEFIKIWNDRYEEVGMQMPRDGAKIKNLIRQTRKYLDAGGWRNDSENVVNLWRFFITNLHKTWCHGKDLAVIDSKYTSILFELKHGKKRDHYDARAAARDFINNL